MVTKIIQKEEVKNGGEANEEVVDDDDDEEEEDEEPIPTAAQTRAALYTLQRSLQTSDFTKFDDFLCLEKAIKEHLRKELSKQLNMKTQRMNKLEKENEQKANKLQENTDTIASLRDELDSLRLNKEQLDEKVSAQERELQKLRKTELEFETFKHQVINNSPPASTQLPAEIETLVQQTPKSPLLSQKLTHLNLLKTPQKTPKGILKQPGSECKRRRVLLVSPERSPSPPPRVEPVDYGVIDLDSEPEPQSRPITPRIRRTPIVGGTISSQTRNLNVRKTPGAKTKGPAEGKRRQEVSAEGASWFDSDPIFGLANED
ncbi:unnamed protein product [Dibothriocephalus latus]|uniref:Uncharacterized protein n=1 Tax=Dibothriocephalus latus TaxID=60516 RepID=A0A3P7LWJ8_DIBLA|nr:unnamed protein product [Dibothriocephalus latus]